jgi:hypothetical protein
MNLQEFLQAPPSNFPRIGWINEGPVKAYMRSGTRYIEGEKIRTLTIATVDVEQEFKGQGYFKRFIDLCSLPNGHDVLYVECINEMRLIGHFERAGWVRDRLYAEDFNFFKRLTGRKE